MNGRTNRWVKPFLVTTTLLLFTACASTQQEEDDSPWSDDMNQVARQLNCPINLTPTCVNVVHEPVRCMCTDKEALRNLLDKEDYR